MLLLEGTVVFFATLVGAAVTTTSIGGKHYVYEELAGYGKVLSKAKDEYGDTIGGIGSGIAIDRKSWRKLGNGSYVGVLWGLPDRGWNTKGTLNYQPRVHKFDISFTPKPNATVNNPASNNLVFTYRETIRFFGPDGTPCTGLDGDPTGHLSFPGFTDLPVATYQGDGFAINSGPPGGRRIPIDSEGIVLDPDGSFWISDEYGPYIYHFSSTGIMLAALRPNDAIIPMRNGTESFSADSPQWPKGGTTDDVYPADNPTGRDNNHGFEGLTITGDGKTLYALLQAATNQEGGTDKKTSRYTRLVKYDISIPSKPRYAAEYVVPLPLWVDPTAKASKNPKTAAQSEIHHIQNGQFFILARDSGSGHGQSSATSIYRHIDIFDIANATNIKGSTYDCSNCSVSPAGILNPSITPANYVSFIDFNLNDQLNRFGVHNGGIQDQNLLNEKWESIAMVPVDGNNGDDDEWYVISLSDNDFITQEGSLDGGKFLYADDSLTAGLELDSQALVFKIALPVHSRPSDREY